VYEDQIREICQIVHEAVSNAIRHADATVLKISAEYGEETFTIVIADNGRGFDVDDIRNHNGLGLRNIQQRARLHGGHVDIESSPGQGTALHIQVPLKPI
jgi:two-component system nitrate/nitrite sensor histidine kinase NarQ